MNIPRVCSDLEILWSESGDYLTLNFFLCATKNIKAFSWTWVIRLLNSNWDVTR